MDKSPTVQIDGYNHMKTLQRENILAADTRQSIYRVYLEIISEVQKENQQGGSSVDIMAVDEWKFRKWQTNCYTASTTASTLTQNKAHG